MGEVKHTPGPWEVVPLSGRCGPFAIRMAAPAGNPTYYGVREIGTEANARLIAAAPDLKAFAKAYLAMADDVTARGTSARPTVAQLNALLKQATDALAKAEGL